MSLNDKKYRSKAIFFKYLQQNKYNKYLKNIYPIYETLLTTINKAFYFLQINNYFQSLV